MSRMYNFVNFVSGSECLSTTQPCERRSSCKNGAMSGDEAKRFYESVVSLNSTRSCGGGQKTNGNSAYRTSDGNTEKVGSKSKTKSNHTPLPESSSSNCDDDFLSTKHRAPKRRKRGSSTTHNRLVNEFLRNAQNGNLKQLKKLIRETAEFDINVTDRFSWSGLMCAVQEGHTHVVKFMLKHGALWEDVCDANGRNALHLAELSGHQDIVSLLKKQQQQQQLQQQQQQQQQQLQQQQQQQQQHQQQQQQQQQQACSHVEDDRKPETFWCTVCQQEFTDSQRKHRSSTVHLFNCQHEPTRTFYYIPEGNLGYQMMLKSGWKEDKGLGPEGVGRKFPVKTVLKRDRSGLGNNTGKEARVTHFGPGDESAVKGRKVIRDQRERKPRKISKKEKLAQKKSERMWENNLRMYMNTE